MELLRVQAVLQLLYQSLHQQILIYIHDHPPIEIHSKGLGTNQHTKSHYSYPSYWQTNSMTWSNASNYINYISCAKFVENNIIPCWCRGCDSWLIKARRGPLCASAVTMESLLVQGVGVLISDFPWVIYLFINGLPWDSFSNRCTLLSL